MTVLLLDRDSHLVLDRDSHLGPCSRWTETCWTRWTEIPISVPVACWTEIPISVPVRRESVPARPFASDGVFRQRTVILQ